MDGREPPIASRARDSLRWRMPLVVEAVIVIVVGTFLGVAYREVRASLMQAAGVRAHRRQIRSPASRLNPLNSASLNCAAGPHTRRCVTIFSIPVR